MKWLLGQAAGKWIAICSQNRVHIWRDRKIVFCRVRHKKCEPLLRLFSVKPCKNYFLIKTFVLWENFFKYTYLFTSKLHFFVSKRAGKLPVYYSNVHITSLLNVKKVKQVKWKKVVKTWKFLLVSPNYYWLKSPSPTVDKCHTIP